MNEIDFEKVGKRLELSRKDKNLSAEEVGKQVGVNRSTVLRWEKGETKNIKIPIIQALAKIYDVNASWLLGYDVSKKEEDYKKLNRKESNILSIPNNVKRIPIIGKISAGLPILAVENIIDYAFAPSSYVQKDYTYFYLQVQGDSMNRKFNDGDIILVQQQDYIENDEIGVFLINDEATVKKYYEEDGIIELRPLSTNPIHKKQEYDPKKVDFKIIGKVISYQGKV